MSRLYYLFGFSLLPGISVPRLLRLEERFGSLERAFKDFTAKDLREAGWNEKITEQCLQARDVMQLQKQWDGLDCELSGYGELNYPTCFVNIHQPPVLLYARGNVELLTRSTIGVVGPRTPTSYGREIVHQFMPDWLKANRTIVSGGAFGIDILAHELAIKYQGSTIVILGGGLRKPYPLEHAKIFQHFIETGRGLIMSEYPPDMEPETFHFPERNRLIAGLSQSLVLIEAGQRSGALITAQLALDQGKDVFALPGPITSSKSQGTNWLIAQGAIPLLKASDVFGLEYVKPVELLAQLPLPELSEGELKVWESLKNGSKNVVDLMNDSGFSMSELNSVLSVLEIKNLVTQDEHLRWGRKYY